MWAAIYCCHAETEASLTPFDGLNALCAIEIKHEDENIDRQGQGPYNKMKTSEIHIQMDFPCIWALNFRNLPLGEYFSFDRSSV